MPLYRAKIPSRRAILAAGIRRGYIIHVSPFGTGLAFMPIIMADPAYRAVLTNFMILCMFS
jgi:hypothetical protein